MKKPTVLQLEFALLALIIIIAVLSGMKTVLRFLFGS